MIYIRKKKLSNKKINLSKKTIIWFVLGLFVSLQVLFTIRTTTSGARLNELELEEKRQTDNSQVLKEKLVEQTSLVEIRKNTDSMGFVKPQVTVYLNTDEFVAKVP